MWFLRIFHLDRQYQRYTRGLIWPKSSVKSCGIVSNVEILLIFPISAKYPPLGILAKVRHWTSAKISDCEYISDIAYPSEISATTTCGYFAISGNISAPFSTVSASGNSVLIHRAQPWGSCLLASNSPSRISLTELNMAGGK